MGVVKREVVVIRFVHHASWVICLCVLAAGCGSGDKPAASPSATIAPGPTVAIKNEFALHEAYATNEAAADATYLDKVVEIANATGRVEKDNRGVYNVVSEYGVVCAVKAGDNAKLVNCPAKPVFRLRGVCRGRTWNKHAYQGFLVTLEGCEILGCVPVGSPTAP